MSELTGASKIKNKAILSAKWAFLAKASQVFGNASIFLILPLWLLPDDFGIITMVSSVLALAMIFQQSGLMEITVQQEENSTEIRNTAFWLNVMLSVILYLTLFIGSPLIARFLNDPRIILPLRIAGLQILLSGFVNIPLAWMQRNFKYRNYATIQFVSSVAMIGCAVTLAIQKAGFWAYIISILLGSLVRLLLVVYFIDWKPDLKIQLSLLGKISKFSTFVMLEMLIGWLFIWFDNIVVARNLGSEAAGIYSLAFYIATTGISLPISAITGVTLPLFSRMQNDRQDLGNAYLQSTQLIALYAIPAGVGLALVGPTLVKVLYPGMWFELGSILPVLAIYAGFGHLWILSTDAFKAIGKPETMLKIYVPIVILMVPIYLISSQYGLLTFTIARSLIVVLSALPHTLYVIRILGLQRFYLLNLLKAPVMGSMTMAAFVWGFLSLGERFFKITTLNRLVSVGIGILLGVLIYALTVHWVRPDIGPKILKIWKVSDSRE